MAVGAIIGRLARDAEGTLVFPTSQEFVTLDVLPAKWSADRECAFFFPSHAVADDFARQLPRAFALVCVKPMPHRPEIAPDLSDDNLSGGVEADALALRATEETACETRADGASGNAKSHGQRPVESGLCRRPAGGPSNSGSSAPPAQKPKQRRPFDRMETIRRAAARAERKESAGTTGEFWWKEGSYA